MSVKRLGAALLKHGLKPGEILSICAPNSIEHVILFYAVARINAVCHLSDPGQAEGMSSNVLLILIRHRLYIYLQIRATTL